MNTNPLLGMVYHWIGGFASATNFIPFRGIKRWSWEVYWLVQGVAAWIVTPLVIAVLLVPHLFHVLAVAPRSAVGYAVIMGMLWGVGGLTFGLSVRYLGIALGYAIALGLCTAFGTLIPPIYTGEIHAILHDRAGLVILAGVGVCFLAVAVNGFAGWSKEQEVLPEERVEIGESEFSLWRGLLIAVGAGIMSSFFAFGLEAGAPIGDVAAAELLRADRLPLWRNLPILVVVLWGGFATNFIWSLVLIVRNRSFRQFGGEPGANPMRASHETGMTLQDIDPMEFAQRIAPEVLVRNYLFAALAGIVWYFQFFFYSLGQTQMGRYDFSSWTLHMASIILFATLWGLVLREWKGTSFRTRGLVTLGILLLIGSTLIVGYGNYLQSRQTPVQASRS